MKKETTQNTENQAVNGMERLIAFSDYLEKIGYNLDALSFQDAVSLKMDVENLISERITK
jgi:hypothetical protein